VSQREALDRELLAWMAEWSALPPREALEHARHPDEARFEALALRLFAFQAEACPAYGRFARARGATPDTVRSWREIPAVPTGAFKEVALRSFPAARTLRTFCTSGTAGSLRGALHLDTLALYEASLRPTLRHLFLPDLEAGDCMPLRVLAPPPQEAPESSLSHMFGCLLADAGAAGSAFDVRGGRLQTPALEKALGEAVRAGRPVGLCGTAFAFVHWLDDLARRGERWRLPAGSRVMETGGSKGRSRELAPGELHALLGERLGVPPERVVNQYGMTELGSQFYDSVLADPCGARRKLGPPWARVRVVDPDSGEDVVEGGTGTLVVHDLANTGSVAAVQTADLGRRQGDGFAVLGRAAGAEARGCSIAADLMLGPDAEAP